MWQHRATVLGIGLLVSVSLAGCVGDATKSASDTPASIPIASVGSDTGPPVVAGPPSPPPEAGEVQSRAVGIAHWQISNLYIGDFASWATQPDVLPLTGDFDGDGRTDVALLKRTAGWGSMPVALSNGDGTWRIINTYIPGDFPGWAADRDAQILTGDFNGDKLTDVALLNKVHIREFTGYIFGGNQPMVGWNTMPVAFADGNGGWRITNSSIGDDFATWAADSGQHYVKVLTGDFNGDKLTDVALVKTFHPASEGRWTTMPVAFANGDGSWRITNRSSGDFAGWAATPGVVPLTGDFNGDKDKRTDVLLVNRKAGWNTMPVALSNGDGTWRVISGGLDKFASWATTSGVKVLTGDFNGDKRTDVALLNQAAGSGWTTMPIAFSSSNDTWQVVNSVSNIGDFAGWAATPGVVPLTGDFDGDGRTDVALVNKAAGWGSMPVAFADGNGGWRITNGSSGGFASWATQPDVLPLTGDFDRDKRTDVLLLRQSPAWGSMPVAFWHDVLLPQTTIQKSSAIQLGPILQRGVEGAPATPAPTEEKDTTSAPK